MSRYSRRTVERVCIVGAGVIGSLFAGHLARVCDVSVLTRRKEHADALERDGLRVTGKTEYHAAVAATDDPAELPPFQVAIVATRQQADSRNDARHQDRAHLSLTRLHDRV